MLSDFLPFLLGQFLLFLQDPVRDPHFAHIMQIGPSADIIPPFLFHTQFLGQLQGQIHQPLGVTFGFNLPQFHGLGPTLDDRVVSLVQLVFGPPEVFVEVPLGNGDRCLSGQRFQEVDPSRIDFQLRPVEDL